VLSPGGSRFSPTPAVERIDRAAARGFIKREPDWLDRRRVLVRAIADLGARACCAHGPYSEVYVNDRE
jgi:DNA-binding MarR family transcriptional regulator